MLVLRRYILFVLSTNTIYTSPYKNTSHFSTSFEMQILFKVSYTCCTTIYSDACLVKKSIQFFSQSFVFTIIKICMYRKSALSNIAYITYQSTCNKVKTKKKHEWTKARLHITILTRRRRPSDLIQFQRIHIFFSLLSS